MKAALTRSPGFASLAIRARLWQPWSHGLIIESASTIVDSTFKLGGVRRRSFRDAMTSASAVRYMDFKLDRETEARDFYHAQVGKGYDWRAGFGILTSSREWRDDVVWFCWELIAAAIEKGSAYRFDDVSVVTARDLLRAERVLMGLEP